MRIKTILAATVAMLLFVQHNGTAAEEPARSVSAEKTDVAKAKFNEKQSVFTGNKLFLAITNKADNNALKPYTLTSVSMPVVSGAQTISIVKNAQQAPVNAVDVLAMTTCNGFPVVALPNAANNAEDSSKSKICLVKNDGSLAADFIANGNNGFKTPAGAAAVLANSFTSLATVGDWIFAAMPAAGGAANGIARVKYNATNDNLDVYLTDGTINYDNAYSVVTAEGVSENANYTYPENHIGVRSVARENQANDPQVPVTLNALCGDDHLGVVYGGTELAEGDAAKPAAACSLFVGRVKADNKFYARPAVDVVKAYTYEILPPVNKSPIIGYKVADATGATSAVYKIATMHTSTGKDYVIANATTGANLNIKADIRALPVMPASAGDNVGMIASVKLTADNKFQLPTDKYNKGNGIVLPINATLSTKVGANYDLLSNDGTQPINQLYVVGDTVYAVCDSARGNINAERGIFASRALFDSTGTIRDWTPWQRVSRGLASTLQCAVDPTTGRLMYLTTRDKVSGHAITRVELSTWGMGDDRANGAPNYGYHDKKSIPIGLTDAGFGPVYNVFAFDDATPGFSRSLGIDLIVATGQKKIALAWTGNHAVRNLPNPAATDKKYEFNKRYDITQAANVPLAVNTRGYVLGGGQLDNLGQITCAEVARITEANANNPGYQKGWLFVAGSDGLGVVCTAAGKGWVTQNAAAGGNNPALAALGGAAAGDFPGGRDFKVARIAKNVAGADLGIANVRRLISDNSFLYIVMPDKIARLNVDIADFAAAAANGFADQKISDDAHFKVIADATSFKAPGGTTPLAADDEFIDATLLRLGQKGAGGAGDQDAAFLVVATSKGVFYNDRDITVALHGIPVNGDVTNTEWTQLNDANGNPLGRVVSMQFVNDSRGGNITFDTGSDVNANGNLYVTAYVPNTNDLAVYRFDVYAGWITPIAEPYKKAGAATGYFYKVGTVEEAAGREAWLGDSRLTPPSLEVSEIPEVPDPAYFLQDLETDADTEINLGLRIPADASIAPLVVDPASGTPYACGNFGVRCNE